MSVRRWAVLYIGLMAFGTGFGAGVAWIALHPRAAVVELDGGGQ